MVGARSNEASALRLHDDGTDLAAALDLLVGCGGFVQREAGRHRQDTARRRCPGGDIGLRPAPIRMRHPGKRHRVDREVFLHQVAHRHLGLAVAVGRVDHDAAIDPQAAQRGGEIAAEIDLGDVVDPDPVGDVEDARGDILAAGN